MVQDADMDSKRSIWKENICQAILYPIRKPCKQLAKLIMN